MQARFTELDDDEFGVLIEDLGPIPSSLPEDCRVYGLSETDDGALASDLGITEVPPNYLGFLLQIEPISTVQETALGENEARPKRELSQIVSAHESPRERVLTEYKESLPRAAVLEKPGLLSNSPDGISLSMTSATLTLIRKETQKECLNC